jgi:hypothetical protein
MKSKRFWLHTGMFVAISFVFVFIALVITFFIDAFFYSTGYARSDGIWELSDSEVLVYEMKKNLILIITTKIMTILKQIQSVLGIMSLVKQKKEILKGF